MESILDSSGTPGPPPYLQDVLEVMEEGTKKSMKKDFVSLDDFIRSTSQKAKILENHEDTNTLKNDFTSRAKILKEIEEASSSGDSGQSESDSESDTSSVTSGVSSSDNDSMSFKSASSVATSDVYLQDSASEVTKPKTTADPCAGDIDHWAGETKLMGVTEMEIDLSETTLADEMNQYKAHDQDDDNCSSSDYSSAVSDVSDDDSTCSFQSSVLDEITDEDESVQKKESKVRFIQKVKFAEDVATIEDADKCFQLDFLRSKLQFSTFQASLLETAFKGMNKRKDQRIVQLEQALAASEDMVAGLIDEANSQNNEREIAESMLENARERIAKQSEKIAKQSEKIGSLKFDIMAKDDVHCHLLDAFDKYESKNQEIASLEETVDQLKANQIKNDADNVEVVGRLEEAHQEMKLLTTENAFLKDAMTSLQSTVPKLESDYKILKAKYVLQEHLAKVNNRKRKETTALFGLMKRRLVEKVESLDRQSHVLTNRLEQHLEEQKKEAVQKELLQYQLQAANERLHRFQKAAKKAAKHSEQGVEKQVIAQVVNKERVKSDLNSSEKVTKALESKLEQMKMQTKDKEVVSLQAKLRFANAKESLLSKALSIKNSDNMEQEDRLKEMSEKLASLRSNLCMKLSENQLLVAKLQELEEQKKEHSEAVVETTSNPSESEKSADSTMKPKSCNRKVNSLEAELSLLQVPDVIIADATLVDSWSVEESEKILDDFDDLIKTSVANEEAGLASKVKNDKEEDEEEWDFLSHSSPMEQQELWC
ncbi:unnamed protein product [Cylindrotheca closterium]|uniref:Uncharacterized protein n=1 Tax=Cylindrotheca closterium TaxID=2856 RepID=A0AAD2GCN0_9STRA|nr:unnamed protein product [Cylindrotheca closterium]